MILWRASLRYLGRHPLQLVFAVSGIALGVAVVVAIDLANDSALRAFRLSAQTVAGRATHEVVGGPGGLAEEVYRTLRVEAGFRASAPVVEGYVGVPAVPGLTMRLVGIDPFAEASFRDYTPQPRQQSDFTRFLTEPGTALLEAGTAARLLVDVGSTFSLSIQGVERSLTLIAVLEAGDEVTRLALSTLVITDIATAQELFGRQGVLSRIDLILPPEEAELKALAALRAKLPAEAQIIPSASRSRGMEKMTRAFQLNLSALSLLALLVGMFLIYNTMTFSILQRRSILGALRTLGVTRRQIFALILGEAVVVGLLGTALGLALGAVLGEGLLRLVTRTINDLYFVLTVQKLFFTPLSFCKWLGFGLGATLAAAVVPAWEATRTSAPALLRRSEIENKARRLLPLAALVGGVVILTGSGAIWVSGKSIVGGFFGLFALVGGAALLVPGIAVFVLRFFQPVMGAIFGVLGKMATRGIIASLSRTGVAIAALVVAVSATVGIGIMIDSFRSTVAHWLESHLLADVYVTSVDVSRTGPGRNPLEPALVERLCGLPQVKETATTRRLFLESERGVSELFVVDLPPEAFARYQFKTGDEERAWRAFEEGAVIISEPYAYHHDLQVGDTVELRTDRGNKTFPIAGIYYDYASDRGRVTISRKVYGRFWNDRSVDALALYRKKGGDVEILVDEVRRKSAGMQQVEVYSNRSLRQASLATFDRTFAITGVLRLLAIVVAFVGILNALMAMQLERSRELAVLRATGLTPRQLWGLVGLETGLIGLVAGLLALPLGIIQALVLIFVINRRSFGWTMQMAIDPQILLQALILALVAALLAGIYPALRMARTSPAAALREE
ncbi:MAG: FtsX-like permease family protein [Desulfuromonadaceae bacterium]|nr:FtsX-like permease family protein [Desulfuromonadaceae bacterium]